MGLGPPKDGFFGFLEKKMVFLVRNHLFLEKKMVVEQPSFEKPSFSRENDGFWRSSPGKTIFFSRKRWFFEGWLLKTIFSREKDGFEPKNHLFLEKTKKNKKTKKTIFSKTMGLGPSRDGFFLEKKMFFEQPLFEKPSFSREKDGFWRSCPGKTIFFSRRRWFLNHLFLEKKMVFGGLVLVKPSFLEKKMVF